MQPFADVAEETSEVQTVKLGPGYHALRVPAGSGHPKLAYLRGIVLASDQLHKIERVRLVECTGCPIFDLTGEHARILTELADLPAGKLRIPIEINPNGLGCLPNMGLACAYRVELILETAMEIELAYEGRPLPALLDAYGEPHPRIPPRCGMLQMWSAILGMPVVAGGGIQFPRVGNQIRSLTLFTYNEAGERDSGILSSPPVLLWDAATAGEFAELAPGVFRRTFEEWLPTRTHTRLGIAGVAAASGSFDVVTNDVAAPSAPA